jgi:acyl carrier protein
MNELESRLIRSFAVVFPDLDETGIRSASPTSVPDWDSVSTVNLINVVEEDFGILIDVDDVEYMVSFDRVFNYLKAKTVGAS